MDDKEFQNRNAKSKAGEGLALRDYQKPVFRDHKSGIVVLHWARQIGKSYTLAAWAVYRLWSRPGRLVTVLSNSRENGAEFLVKCAEICRLSNHKFLTVVNSREQGFEDMRIELRVRIGRQTQFQLRSSEFNSLKSALTQITQIKMFFNCASPLVARMNFEP